MLFLLSPAKTLDYKNTLESVTPSTPDFLEKSAELIKLLKKLSCDDISSLMSLSDKLAQINVERYNSWDVQHENTECCKPAISVFKGDVYQGLNISSFSLDDLYYSQSHLRILSGLYGLLKPLDLMQPYRLEMGTKLNNAAGENLYHFWKETITNTLNSNLENIQSNYIINLASNEYFSAVDIKKLKAEVISPIFKDYKNGKYKIISFYAKKARGNMAAWAIKKRILKNSELTQFNLGGYNYSLEESTTAKPVFLRRLAD